MRLLLLFILTAFMLSGCETLLVPVPEARSDGGWRLDRVGLNRAASCRIEDGKRTDCISECNQNIEPGREESIDCINWCISNYAPCGPQSILSAPGMQGEF